MACELTGRRCDVDGSVGRVTDDADREIAQGRKDAWDGPGSDLGTVLVEGVVPNPMQALDRPVASHQAEKVLDAGMSLGEVGHGEAGLDTDPDIVEGRRFAFDDDESACVREGRPLRDWYVLGPVAVGASVASVSGLVLGTIDVDRVAHLDCCIPQLWLVLFHAQDVVTPLADDEPRCVLLGVHRVRSDDLTIPPLAGHLR